LAVAVPGADRRLPWIDPHRLTGGCEAAPGDLVGVAAGNKEAAPGRRVLRGGAARRSWGSRRSTWARRGGAGAHGATELGSAAPQAGGELLFFLPGAHGAVFSYFGRGLCGNLGEIVSSVFLACSFLYRFSNADVVSSGFFSGGIVL
jgi:hypothetical protein